MPVPEDNTAERNPPALALVESIIAYAKMQLGKPYKLGAEGPSWYDCSGLVYDCFLHNNALELIGGGRHRARWYERWFRDNGHFTEVGAGRGDLIFYGHEAGQATHVGIYLGPPKRRVISALVNPFGVTRHRFNAISTAEGNALPVLGYGHVAYPE